MKAHPQVKVHVEYSRTDKVCQACLDDAIDFGIVAFPLRRANLTVLPWHEEKLVLVCRPDHRFTREVGVIHRRGRELGAAARAFIATLGVQM